MQKFIDLSKSNKRFLPHILLWLMYGIWSYTISVNRLDHNPFVYIQMVLFIAHIFIFYVNYAMLVPRFYLKKSYGRYFASVVGMLVFMMVIDNLLMHSLLPFDEMAPEFHSKNFPKPHSEGGMPHFKVMRIVPGLMGNIVFLLLSSLLRAFEESGKTEQKMADLKAEKYNAELKFLRSQINPHFLFNALNNIYSLVISKSEKAPDMLLKLSDMLRYLIYECNEEEVAINREIEYIANYIALQKLKDDQIKNITFNYENSDQLISPMLLMPFVENAFKHSRIEDDKSSWIIINLKIENNEFYFEVLNTIPKKAYKKDALGGVGIDNVKRRLDMIYPDKYDLNIQTASDSFNVYLKIAL